MFAPRSLPIRRSAISFAIALAAMLTACDDTITAPSVPAPVSTVEVVGSTAGFVSGEERDFSVRLRNADGALLTGRQVEWSSSNASVATVTAAGRVTAVGVGAAEIRARSEGRLGRLEIEVQSAPVVSIVLSETHFTLNRNSARQLQATARDAYGRPVSTAAFNWSSDDATVATVNSAGQVTAIASGTTRIVARAGGIESSVMVTVPVSIAEVRLSPPALVLNVGGSFAYAVQVFDDRGRLVPGHQVAWSSSTPTVAAVSSTGLVTAVSRGYATITARVGAVTGSVAVTVVSNDWVFNASLFTEAILIRADTSNRTEHGFVVTEARLQSARLTINRGTGAWSFTGQVVHSDRSVFLGNVIYRETGRQTVTDYGSGSEIDASTGERLLVSAQNSAVRFRFATAGVWGSLTGEVRGFPMQALIPLTY